MVASSCFFSVNVVVASCHCEEDDFIAKPPPMGFIIKGVARSSSGKPIVI